MGFDRSKPFAESRNERGFCTYIQDDKHYNQAGDEVTANGKEIVKEVVKPPKAKQVSAAVDAQLDAQLS